MKSKMNGVSAVKDHVRSALVKNPTSASSKGPAIKKDSPVEPIRRMFEAPVAGFNVSCEDMPSDLPDGGEPSL